MKYIPTISLMICCFVAIACKKQVASLSAPENELVSSVEVTRSGRPVLNVDYVYDNFDRMIRMDVFDVANDFQEQVEFKYGSRSVRINVTGFFASGIKSKYSVQLTADENLIINGYTFEPATGTPKTYTFTRDEVGRIVGVLEEPEGLEISYNDFGISTTRMLTNDDLSNPIYRIELLEPYLLETYVPGINNIAIIPELRRDAYPLQPFYLGNLSFKVNPSPLNLPEQSILSGEAEAKPLNFHFQYARDIEGRITEMRKFTKDFLVDYRVKFSYQPKRLP